MYDILHASKAVGLSIPVPDKHLPSPSNPLKRKRMEKEAQLHSDGMRLQDAILQSAPEKITRNTASSRVSKLHKDEAWMARYEYLKALKANDKGAKPTKPGLGAPIGEMPDLETSAGRRKVWVDIVSSFYSGNLKSESALKALAELTKLYGDQEQAKAERERVPVEAIIGHLLQCELDGRDPLNLPLADLAPIICKLLGLVSVTLASASEVQTHRAKRKEATDKALITHKQGIIEDNDMHTVCNDTQPALPAPSTPQHDSPPNNDKTPQSDPTPTP